MNNSTSLRNNDVAVDSYRYGSLFDGAHGLLGEVCSLVEPMGLRYVIVGGWSPCLFNSSPIAHPGTRDVDVLFENGATAGELGEVIQRMLDSGFTLSAKHEFQVLRRLNVSGTPFMFNVDILHPSEGKTKPEMFVDHLQLPIPASEFRDEQFAAKSIVIPQSQFLFRGHIDELTRDFVLPSGMQRSITIPLMDEIGTIVTKSKSSGMQKRPRDAFDIFMAIVQARDRGKVVSGFHELKRTDRPTFNTLYDIKKSLDDDTFVENVRRFLPQQPTTTEFETFGANEQNEQIRYELNRFLKEVTLDPKASNV